MTYVITETCIDVKDMGCIEECPVDCIYEGSRMLYIHPDECVDCGACEPVCPVEAIYYEDDVPEGQEEYHRVAAEIFDELGSPGGSSKVGPLRFDHPFVTGPEAGTAKLEISESERRGALKELLSSSFPEPPVATALVSPIHQFPGALIGALLLFYDRILVIHDSAREQQKLSMAYEELISTRRMEISDIRAWVSSFHTPLVNSCSYLCSSGEIEHGAFGTSQFDGHARLTMELLYAISGEKRLERSPELERPFRFAVRLLLPQLVRNAASEQGRRVDTVTGDGSFASEMRQMVHTEDSGESGVWDYEPILPDLSQVPISELIQFRLEHAPLLDGHLTLMKRNMTEPGRDDCSVAGFPAWAIRRDQIAESSYTIRRAARSLAPGTQGTWALGAVGDLGRPGRPVAVGRQAMDASGVATGANGADILLYAFRAPATVLGGRPSAGLTR